MALCIQGRNIPEHERVDYLKRYLGDFAPRCVEGYLVIPTTYSYNEAIALTDKRFGNNITIANEYNSKIEAWPKIAISTVTSYGSVQL